MKKNNLTRRAALKGMGAGVCAFNIVPRYVLGGPGYTPPSEILTRGVIGVGGMGQSHLKYGGSQILAVCDARKTRVKKAVETCKSRGYTACKGYSDFRDLIARPDLDIVSIVTPPHWHGLMAIAAAEAGKDVWCEKPMTRTIAEGQGVVDACRRNGTMLRINTWFRMHGNFYGSGATVKDLKKVVDSGMLGWPLKVTVSAHTGFNWKISGWSGKINEPVVDVPDDLDYDMWLGPAPVKPYTKHRAAASFRGYWDYDGGGLGDMGMHYLDPIQYLLNKDHTSPIRVEVDTDPQHSDAARAWRKVRLVYADGCEIILDGDNSLKDAAYLEGPDGKVFKGFRSTIPNLRNIVRRLPDPAPMISDFHESVRTRKRFGLDELKGHRSTTLVNMSKIALRLNRTLRYDPVKEQFIKDEEANRYVSQPMRGPWSLNEGVS